MTIRGAYRKDRRTDVDALMRRRKHLGLSLNALADAAGLTVITLRRIKATGFAFPRQMVAISQALRNLEREAKRHETMFEGTSHDG